MDRFGENHINGISLKQAGMAKDITVYVAMVVAGLLIVQSQIVLFYGITAGFIGLVLIAGGLWGVFGDEIRQSFKK